MRRPAALAALAAGLAIAAAPTLALAAELPDHRAWELVSPVDKNGGAVQGPGQLFGGGVLQAAANGNSIAYSSSASFGTAPQGAPPASQYISRRGAGGWSTENITQPTLSGAYGDEPDGVPYQLFSTDLARGLLLNGSRCAPGEPCPRSYSLREEGGALTASPAAPDLRFAGASPDLRHLVLSTCAALTPEATEVPAAEGCDPTKPNLYEWSGGVLTLINTNPGAHLAAQATAVSADGSRVYFTEAGKLWLREGSTIKQVDEAQAGGGEFQTATPDGSLAFFTKAGHLFRYAAHEDLLSTIDLTPSGGVLGVLGISQDGSSVYFQDTGGLELYHEGAITQIAPGAAAAAPRDWPPTTGTARVSPDGAHLAFLSTASLTGYDNTDQATGEPDTEVYLYQAPAGGGGGTLACASCNPTGARPLGPSTIPGAIPNGEGALATDFYKPRALSADGARLFFDSADALVLTDTNNAPDVYQWEAAGVGTCTEQSVGFFASNRGCLSLISAGQGAGASTFIDASADGRDAFFLTADPLVPRDPGSVDLYDARQGGGFPEPTAPTPCDGDACQALPSPPEDPTPTSLLPGPANPPLHFPRTHHKPQHHKKHHRKRANKRRGLRSAASGLALRALSSAQAKDAAR